jgi:indolepyruvate ferredoxin oxidoreductase
MTPAASPRRGVWASCAARPRPRRTERRLAAGYEADMRAVVAGLSSATHATAVEPARLPLAIRGYEQIKLAAVARYENERERLRGLPAGAAVVLRTTR